MVDTIQYVTVKDNPTDEELRKRCVLAIKEWYGYYVIEICRNCGAFTKYPNGKYETPIIVKHCYIGKECF